MILKKHPKWMVLENRVNAMSVRERGIMLGLLVALLVGVVDQAFLGKGFARMQEMRKQLQESRDTMRQSEATVVALAEQRARDPDQEVRTEIAALAAKKSTLDHEIEQISEQFVSPGRMPAVLGKLLNAHDGLRVQSVKSLPVREVALGEGESAVRLYEHSVELKFTGGFVGLRDYLRDIEAMEKSLIWDRLLFSLNAYPSGDIELVVKTLGTGKEFIGVYR